MKNMPTVTDNEELTIQAKDYDLIVTHLAHPGLWSRPSKLWLALALDPINHQLRCTNQIVEARRTIPVVTASRLRFAKIQLMQSTHSQDPGLNPPLSKRKTITQPAQT